MRYRRAIKVLIHYGFWENKMFNGIIGDRWMGEIDGRGVASGVRACGRGHVVVRSCRFRWRRLSVVAQAMPRKRKPRPERAE